MLGKPNNKLFLRIYALWMLAFVFVIFFAMGTFVTQWLHSGNYASVENGRIRLDTVANGPIYLNGQWEAFDGAVENTQQLAQLDDMQGRPIQFPIGELAQAEKDATYRIQVAIPQGTAELSLVIPTYDGKLKIFLDGKEQQTLVQPKEWLPFGLMETLASLDCSQSDGQWQELVISGQFSQNDITLLKRPVIIGNIADLSTLTVFNSSNEMFLMGIFALMLVNGYVFMMFRPNHTLISLITLFDTFILGRIAFAMPYAHAQLKAMLPQFALSDRQAMAIALFFLMLGGIMGCILSGRLFDPQGKAPKWLIKPCPYIYGLFAIIFPFHLDFFAQYGSKLLYGVYVYTFIGVFWQFCIRWKSKDRRGYYIFQFVKTIYIGIIIFGDIWFWNQYIDFSYLYYLYAIFFVLHVVIRLYDNDQSYRNTESLNQNLEKLVAERTEELSEANRILSELSVRDPLTNAFNRLYFERAMDQAVARCEEEHGSVYLCMFDLDFFKTINDTYGHDAGDAMLKWATGMVQDTVKEDATLARIGGEEFILLFENKTQKQMMKLVEQIKGTMELQASHNPRYTTASFGISQWTPGDVRKTMLKKADRALYQAKEQGRNKIIMFGQDALGKANTM